MLLLHQRTSAQTQSSQHWTCEEEKMSILTWKTSANHANISTSNREVYCRALPTNNHKRQKQNWSNTIHIKNANKKTKMITPPSTDKDKTKVISPQITSKGNCKEKHDLTTNHRQRLPGWRLFRLGKGTTLDRVQSLYPERNYFLWFLGFASQPSAILWGWEVTVFYNVHHRGCIEKKYDKRDLETDMISLAPLVWIGIVTSSNPARAGKVSLLHNKDEIWRYEIESLGHISIVLFLTWIALRTG